MCYNYVVKGGSDYDRESIRQKNVPVISGQ